MKSIFSLLIICLISFPGKAQVLEYLNEFSVPIINTKKYEPSFFRITSGDSLKLSVKTYSLDTTLRYEKRSTRFDLNQEFSNTEIWYFESGKRKKVLQFDANTSKAYQVDYYESGAVKSKVEQHAGEIHSEEYFSEDGDSISKPVIIDADFIGGIDAWNEYIWENLGYPVSARRMGKSGVVLVAFTVTTTGEMKDVEVVNPEEVFEPLAKEALRVVMNYSGKFSPKTIDGVAVPSQIIMPVRFQLN
ncbi:energy transducer TonB [Algoriphagus formosus]|uniref:energy transducer TonB n=1 Tax=Algoriphagus formosus TaxID=2007308 RepID=UPI000C287907|nr:energy transducer TonB [Algoriphagus formosus]